MRPLRSAAVVAVVLAASYRQWTLWTGVQPDPEPVVAQSSGHYAVSDDLAHFESGLTLAAGNPWQSMSDEVLDGRSSASILPVDDGAGGTALRIEGEVRLGEFPFSFAGAAAPMGPVVAGSPLPVDVSCWEGVELRVRGDGGRYALILQTAGIDDYAHYQTVLRTTTDWETVLVSLDALRQPVWGERRPWDSTALTGLVISTYTLPGKEHGPFWVEIDDLRWVRSQQDCVEA